MSITEAAAGGRLRTVPRWPLVAMLGLALFINYIDRGNLATAAPLIKRDLNLSATELGVLTSAFFWTYVPGQLVAGLAGAIGWGAILPRVAAIDWEGA